MSGSLAGKRALVTGAGRGIGAAIANAFEAEGALVARADTTAPKADPNGLGLALDVRDEAQIVDAFAAIERTWNGLDIVVNNAGVLLEKPLVETTADEFDELMSVNLRGTFLVGREAARTMQRRPTEGRIVNIASELAYLGRETFSVYCASKSAILGLTKSWARELSPGILVNAIAPGPIDTDMLAFEAMSPEWRANEMQNPMGRIGQPAEIGSMAVFLAGPGATFITGQCFSVDGGAAMH